MIPILFDKSATTWTTNGLGRLSEAISCKVTEERNGEYELEMQYPVSGHLFKYLVNDNIIYAKAFEGTNDDHVNQPFRIYKVSKPLSGKVTVSARHNSYRLSYTPVGFVPSAQRSAKSSLSAITSAIKDPSCPYKFSTDISSAALTFGIDAPMSIRSALGGDKGFLDTYGGEIKWDDFNVSILSSRGRDNGVTIRYGKNLTDLKEEENIEKTYTAIFGYYKADAEASTPERKIEGSIIKCANASNFPYIRTYIYDCSSDFNDTVMKGYRVGQNFYKDSDHKEGVLAIKNNYYEDSGTIITGYFNGSSFFTDSDNKKQISPEFYKYYSDGNTMQRGYIQGNRFFEDSSHETAITPRLNVYYVDQSTDTNTIYIWNGSTFIRQPGEESDYTNYKGLYTWNGSSYQFYKLTQDATNEIKNYVWRFNGSNYEIEQQTIPLVSDIDRLATKYMNEHDFGVPEVSMTVSYQPLWETEEYKDLYPIESVKLCDTITVIFEKLGVHTTAKVTKTVYNTLLNRYDSIEVDSNWNKNKTRDLSGTIANQSNTIKEVSTGVSQDLREVIQRQAEMITGGLGGYVKFRYDKNNLPEELLVMDESDYTKAKNVIRLNKNGIAFSQTGYQGPFTSAWTIDGTFSANWITTGLLTAITMQTASTGLRIVIEGLTSAIKGMSGNELVNVIDMINGSGPDAKMLFDAKEGMVIRTPKLQVVGKSFGTGAAEVNDTRSDGFNVVTSVKKNMDNGYGDQHTTEIALKGVDKSECDVYCTLPVYLKVGGNQIHFIDGLAITGAKEWSEVV